MIMIVVYNQNKSKIVGEDLCFKFLVYLCQLRHMLESNSDR